MNQANPGPFLAWPGWAQIRFAALVTLLVSLWFGVVFLGADWVTAHRSTRVRVHLTAELDLPLIPAFVAIYLSIHLLFLAVPFVLRTRQEVAALARAQFITILAGGIAFLLLPGQLAYAPPGELGVWKTSFHFADWLNLDYNLVPSLHVALSIVCIEFFARRASVVGKVALRSWGVLIAASTLFTHQHHLLDVVAGYGLALVVVLKSAGTPSRFSNGIRRYSS